MPSGLVPEVCRYRPRGATATDMEDNTSSPRHAWNSRHNPLFKHAWRPSSVGCDSICSPRPTRLSIDAPITFTWSSGRHSLPVRTTKPVLIPLRTLCLWCLFIRPSTSSWFPSSGTTYSYRRLRFSSVPKDGMFEVREENMFNSSIVIPSAAIRLFRPAQNSSGKSGSEAIVSRQFNRPRRKTPIHPQTSRSWSRHPRSHGSPPASSSARACAKV